MHPPSHASEVNVVPVASQKVISQFVRACGLRKAALARLRVGDVWQDEAGWVWIGVTAADTTSIHVVPVLKGFEQDVLSVVEGRQIEELVFPHLPKPLFLQRDRIFYARALYDEISANHEEPYDEEQIIQFVMKALGEGHHRYDVVRRYYLGRSSRK